MNGPPPTDSNPDSDPSNGTESVPTNGTVPAEVSTGTPAQTPVADPDLAPPARPRALEPRPLPGVAFDPASVEPRHFLDRLRSDKNLVGFLALAVLLVGYCTFELGGLVESTNRQPVPFGPLPATSVTPFPGSRSAIILTDPPAPASKPVVPQPVVPQPVIPQPQVPQTLKAADGEEVETDTTDTGESPRRKRKAPTAIVDINTADLNTLETLPGVGPKTAEKILNFRKAHNGFDNVNELLTVGGIGEKKLAKMAPWVKVG